MENHLQMCYAKTLHGHNKLDNDIMNMDGMSGVLTRVFYNNLLDMDDARYLEIGTWKGSSLCSAMCNNKAKVTCIDNWAQFGGPRDEFFVNFNKYKGDNDAHVIESDSFADDILSKLPFKYNIYMYDGDHTSESHCKALTHFIDAMDDTFIFVVDDWNWSCVREGTMKGIKDCNLKILFQNEIRLTHDDSHTPTLLARLTWHNGIAYFVLKK